MIETTLIQVLTQDRGRLLAALIAQFRDFQLAEDALQDAAASALVHWGRTGLPHAPQGWLLTVARRKAIDRLRRQRREGDHAAAIALLAAGGDEEPEAIPDDRLRLIFTCCHPALGQKSQVALTLRTVCGLSPPEFARAFLDAEPAMGQRLTRAKAKIAAAGIPFAIPGPAEWADRLNAVLTVIYLIFNAGYSPAGDSRDLTGEAVFLARLVNSLSPDQPEVMGLLALLLITHARQAARIDATGASIALADQDHDLWDHAAIAEGLALLDLAIARRTPGPFQIKAAIAACHVQNGRPDWPQIAALYDSLLRMEPTPVVRLNRAVALAESGAGQAALQELDRLAPDLADYQPYHAARAEYLGRAGCHVESRVAYDRAIALGHSAPDAVFLARRRDLLPD